MINKINVENIIKSFKDNKISHSFLIETNNVDNCLNDIRYIIKYIECENHLNEENECNICNLIDNDNNPDVVFISPEGKEIKSDKILSLITKFSTKPLVSKYSIYVINGADYLNDSSSNKLLKFLEEPEGNIIGFYITSNVNKVLNTIRSRCEFHNFKYDCNNLVDLLGVSQDVYDNLFDVSLDLVSRLNTEPKYLLLADSKKFAKYERVDILNILKLMRRFYTIKYEYDNHLSYQNLDFVNKIIDYVAISDMNLIVKRIKLLDNSINDFEINLNKELFFNNFFISWE